MHSHNAAPALFSTRRIATLFTALLVSLASGTNYVRLSVMQVSNY